MKTKSIIGAVAVAASMGMASTAMAFDWGGYTGPIKMKFTNYDEGALYQFEEGQDGPYGTKGGSGVSELDALPQTGPVGGVEGEDGWGIFRLESITNETGTITIWNRFESSFEITGMFWGLQDTYMEVTNAGTAFETQAIDSNNLNIAFFMDEAKNYDPSLGPTARTGEAEYPTVTDGQLIWTATSVPGFYAGEPDEFFVNFEPQGSGPGLASSAGGFLADWGAVPHWGTGPGNTALLSNPISADAEFNFTADADLNNGWLLESDDPVRAHVIDIPIPEPLSASLGLMGLGALVVSATRRRR